MAGERATSKKQHKASHIEKIRQSAVLNRLIKHALGKVKMSSTQVAAAKALINKYLPDVRELTQEINLHGEFIVSDQPSIDEFDKDFAVGAPTRTTDSTD